MTVPGSNSVKNHALSRRSLLKTGLYAGLATLGGGLFVGGCGRRRRARPNILLITIDTVRPDFLGCYGYSKNTSPNLDAFAAESLLFEKCLTHAPETRLSFASILTGFWPHETKVTTNRRLPNGLVTVAETLLRNGYDTAAVISNYMLRKTLGYEQGFAVYDDAMQQREIIRKWPERIAQYTTDRAIKMLTDYSGERFFMWIHYQDPHGPYTPPQPYSKMFIDPAAQPRELRLNDSLSGIGGIPAYQRLGRNLDFNYYVSQYEGELRYQDEHFGRLVAALKKLRYYDDTFIILTSDHGEGMGEHNYYFAHGETLYQHMTHVPLMIRFGRDFIGRRSDVVQQIDFAPTILNIAGVEPQLPYRGRDLRREYDEPPEVFAEMKSPLLSDGVKFSLVSNGLKMIYTPLYGTCELYNLQTDPAEEQDLINSPDYATTVPNMKTKLLSMRKDDRLGITDTGPEQQLSEEELEKLKSLGYLE